MKKDKKYDLSPIQTLLLFGLFSVIYTTVILTIEIYSGHDLKAFHTWSRALLFDPKRIYEVVYNQYPLFGYYVSTFIFTEYSNWKDAVLSYRIFLIFNELLLLIVYYYMLRMFMDRKRSLVFSFLITSLPAVYSSTSLFGQIDGIIHLFIVMSALLLIKMYQHSLLKRYKISLLHFYNFFFAFFLVFAIHTKQLSFFPGITISIFYVFVLLLMNKNKVYWKEIIWLPLVSLFLLVIITRILDSMVTLPDGIFTIYEFILKFRSGHLSSLSGGAYNIWMFIEGAPNRASDVVYIGSISVLHAGYFLTTLCFIVLLFFIIKINYVFHIKNKTIISVTKLASFMFLSIAFITLGSYIFMSGMYDRFNIYTFPFYLLGVILLWKEIENKKQLYLNLGLAAIGSLVYGGSLIFVYAGVSAVAQYAQLIAILYVVLIAHLIYLLHGLTNIRK